MGRYNRPHVCVEEVGCPEPKGAAETSRANREDIETFQIRRDGSIAFRDGVPSAPRLPAADPTIAVFWSANKASKVMYRETDGRQREDKQEENYFRCGYNQPGP